MILLSQSRSSQSEHAPRKKREKKRSVDPLDLIEKLIEKKPVKKINFRNVDRKFLKKTGKPMNRGQFLEYLDSVPTVYCNKCIFNSTCPMYVKNSVCGLINAGMEIKDRHSHTFIKALYLKLNHHIRYSSVFTEEGTSFDYTKILEYAYFLNRMEEDKNLPDVTPSFSTKKKELAGRVKDGHLRIYNYNLFNSNCRRNEKMKIERLKILGYVS